ncbi:MAG: right-handed parallel beta-helix repeat-containing protein [Planctomycetota bacterium]|jgi:hypothetical protein
MGLAILMIVSSLCGPARSGVLLYDVDFGSPPHVVGKPPTVGDALAPRRTPTKINFGGPVVVDAVGALADQPCKFVAGQNYYRYGQLVFSMSGLGSIPGRFYILEMDILIESLLASSRGNSSFALLLDTPYVRNVIFTVDGNIRLYIPDILTQVIGTWSPGEPLHLRIEFDVVEQWCGICIDGIQAYTGPLYASRLGGFRLNIADRPERGSVVGVDNIRVWRSQEMGLSGLELRGPEQVRKNTTVQYKATAFCSDCSAIDVTDSASWSVQPDTQATIDQQGRLTTGEIVEKQTVTVYASYTDGTGVVTAEHGLTLYPPGVHHVDADANGANDGSSWADAFKYLRDASEIAGQDDEIWVAGGVYTPDSNTANPDGTGDRNAAFHLKNDVILKGGYAGLGEPEPNDRDTEAYETILSGDLKGNDRWLDDPAELMDDPCRVDNSYHVVMCSGLDATVVLDGFTITGGNARAPAPQSRGGGLCSQSSSLRLTSCKFVANSAGSGGGVYDQGGEAMLTHCTFMGNSAGGGGGIHSVRSESTLGDCIFIGNSGKGGGMWTRESSHRLTSCVFRDNSSRGRVAGGMLNYESNLILRDCTFIGNSVTGKGGHGGAIVNEGETVITLTNCTLTGNIARQHSGGMNNSQTEGTFTNCVFTGNWAGEWGGGGMRNTGGCELSLINCVLRGNHTSAHGGGGLQNENEDTSVKLVNCMLAGNSDIDGTDESAQIISYDGTTTVEYSCVQDADANDANVFPGIGNIDDDPLFVEAGYWSQRTC